jgi:hypothetical protein
MLAAQFFAGRLAEPGIKPAAHRPHAAFRVVALRAICIEISYFTGNSWASPAVLLVRKRARTNRAATGR